MAWRGSVSRSLMSTARASAFRSATPISAPRLLRPPSAPSPRFNSRRFSFSNPRTLGELGSTQSLMPVMGSKLTSYLASNLRAFYVLEHLVGTLQLVLDDDLGTWLIGAENSLFGEKVEIIDKHRIMDIPVFVDETLISDIIICNALLYFSIRLNVG
ncbi:hypothetical protein OROGR_009780 [Orobanche gracilis]